jgi:ABC-type amino acid transport system permease subunit
MKTSFITPVVIVVLIFIFIIWSFNLKDNLEEQKIKDGFIYILKQAQQEIKNIWQDFKKETKFLEEETTEESSLIKEEINRLKDKILDYEE